MGDHTFNDSLGSSPLVTKRSPRYPDTARPPVLPKHHLRLLNWSRTSRRRAGLLWYLALPFTLVNLMGYMAPARRGCPRIVAFAVTVLVGIVATMTAHVWLIAIGETFFRAFQPLREWELLGEVNVTVWSVLLFGLVIVRWIQCQGKLDKEKHPSGRVLPRQWLAWTSLLSLTTIVLTGALLAIVPATRLTIPTLPLISVTTPKSPGQMEAIDEAYPGNLSESMCIALRDGNSQHVFASFLDPLSAIVVLGLATGVLCWLLLTLVGLLSRGRQALASLSAASLAAIVALILVNLVGATLRLGLTWLLVLLSGMPSAAGWVNHRRPWSLFERHVMAYQGDRVPACELDMGFIYNGTKYIDTIPVICGLGLLAGWIALRVVNRSRSRALKGLPKEVRKARLHHAAISTLGDWLWWAMLLTGILWATFVTLGWTIFDNHLIQWRVSEWHLFGWYVPEWDLFESVQRVLNDLIAIVTVVVAIFVLVFVLSGGRLSKTREALALVADIAGFWYVRFHPLAGDTYRPRVIAGLRDEVESHGDAPLVLVGHSQGSVISAWFVATTAPFKFGLVTCGSPLRTLYATFFPEHFDEKFFAAVNARSTGWLNTWRETDPIASPVVDGDEEMRRDIELPDPTARGDTDAPVLLGHSDYWDIPKQAAAVRLLACIPKQELDRDSSTAPELTAT